jgi:hypothetical protein
MLNNQHFSSKGKVPLMTNKALASRPQRKSQIQAMPWIRIRIRNPDPHPGGQKSLTIWKKVTEFNFFEVPDVLF